MRFMTMFRAVSLVSALAVALALVAVSAEVPIPVDTELNGGAWEDGVYLQVFTQRVFDEHGQAIGKEVTHCRLLVQTTVDGIGEVMTAVDQDSNAYQAVVKPVSVNRVPVAGRATFMNFDPGTTLTTTNTSPVVVGACPAS